MTYSLRTLLLTLFATTVSTSILAEPLHKFAVLDGVNQELILEPNTKLSQVSTNGDTHYAGYLKDFPQSWVRVSRIGDTWDGMIVHNDQLYLISDLTDAPRPASALPKFSISAFSDYQALGECGIEHAPLLKPAGKQSQSISVSSLVTSASTVDYPSYCAENVDGVCLVAELTVLFDSDFQQTFPGDYSSRAATILNAVDGFYKNQFNIVFNHLNIDFSNAAAIEPAEDPRDPGSILDSMYEKRFNGQTTAFDPNRRSIMHLVTGRDFVFVDNDGNLNDNVVGLAYSPFYTVGNFPNSFSPVMCDAGGATVSTSQVVDSSTSLTAVVVAHEIGHNLGADHDADPDSVVASSCTDSNKIMYPNLIPGASQFSTCSKTTIYANLNRLSPIENCFDFPIEAGLTADIGNGTQAGAGQTLQHDFTVALTTANGKNGTVQVKGTIPSGNSAFTSVLLAGTPCTLSNANKAYTCTANNLASTNTLAVSFTTGSEDTQIVHSLSLGSNLYDLDDANNSVTSTVIIQGADLPPTSLTALYSGATQSINLDWQDHSDNEEAFIVERKIDSGNWEILTETLPANTTEFTDTSIVQNSYNYYRVRAVFGGIPSASSNEVGVAVNTVKQVWKKRKKGGGALDLWLMIIAGLAYTGRRRLLRS